MLSRFTSDGSKHRTLKELDLPRDVWPIGRLDADSEGLLILSSDKRLVDRLLSPRHEHTKTYWVQVERVPDAEALSALERGVVLDGRRTAPARARIIEEPKLWERDPPIRHRKSVATAWIELVITEGRNRQVRRMTAAVGHPTLRLVRWKIGELSLGSLLPGDFRVLDARDNALLMRP
jgi:23S rRNA pseudouridine2457 synthase